MVRLAFLIAGVQKAGTTALARYLERHPQVRLPRDKEAHVFDAPDASSDADEDRARLAATFDGALSGLCPGDATPITLFQPAFIERALRHAPDLRWIVLLREPVARTVSHWAMERARGTERLPFSAAMLAEPLRWRRRSDWGWDSPRRWASYAARSDYAPQLRALAERVPRDRILLIRSDELARAPERVVQRVWAFLDLPPGPEGLAYPRVFEGHYDRPAAWSPGRWWLRWRLRDARRRWARGGGLEDWLDD